MTKPIILVTGSVGQLGSELTTLLRDRYGPDNVIAGVHSIKGNEGRGTGPQELVDVMVRNDIKRVVKEYEVDTIYHLAAVLSATGEDKPDLAWTVNLQGLKNLLDVSRELSVSRIFWPSSMAVFGPDAPRENTLQEAPLRPTTMYGVTKAAGELLCNYYSLRYETDVRCVRYPGLISSKTKPAGGTTDYAVAMFYDAIEKGSYVCFVREDTILPMMYMPDALKAALQLMEAPRSMLKWRMGYNVAAMSFSAGELVEEIRKYLPGFKCSFQPDGRQRIADSWPRSIDDSVARTQWGWSPSYDIHTMTESMIRELTPRLKKSG